MSILDIKDLKNENIFNIVFSIIILLFGIIYEVFSHGVISYFMIFAFLIPIINFLINILFIKCNIKVFHISKNIFTAGVITLTLASIVKGVLDIYGTTNKLIFIYPVVGIILLIISIIIEVNITKSE